MSAPLAGFFGVGWNFRRGDSASIFAVWVAPGGPSGSSRIDVMLVEHPALLSMPEGCCGRGFRDWQRLFRKTEFLTILRPCVPADICDSPCSESEMSSKGDSKETMASCGKQVRSDPP